MALDTQGTGARTVCAGDGTGQGELMVNKELWFTPLQQASTGYTAILVSRDIVSLVRNV